MSSDQSIQPGQRFELDLEADDDFTVRPVAAGRTSPSNAPVAVGAIREHDHDVTPAAPSLKSLKSGFPEHHVRRPPSKPSTFRQRQQGATPAPERAAAFTHAEPSDRAIAHHLGEKYGVDWDRQQKAEVSHENRQRLAQMSTADIEEARAELRRTLNPAFVDRLLKRANIDEDQAAQAPWPGEPPAPESEDTGRAPTTGSTTGPPAADQRPAPPSVHFPVPPRPADDYVPLNPDDASFLSDLKAHYFADTPHDATTLRWLQDPTEEDEQQSLYHPAQASFPASALRFGFTGRLIPPTESLEIDVTAGLHHHGDAPSSAGYTIPELALLARSALPNQRCLVYQVLGRILYRLGRGDFGPRGAELHEALWSVVEKERPIEVMMAEANRQSGHASAQAYATEALWLWRKGGGGDRGLLKPGQRQAK